MAVSYNTWLKTGRYPSGPAFNPNDPNLKDYYNNYVRVWNSSTPAHRNAVDKQHGFPVTPLAAPSSVSRKSSPATNEEVTLDDIGPYPENNVYFPMLTQAYNAPSASDWSEYMPQPGPFANPNIPDLTGGAIGQYEQAVFPGSPQVVADQDYSGMGGLLYQPWSTEYQQAFVPPNLWNYDPVQFDNPVVWNKPFSPLTVHEYVAPKPKSGPGPVPGPGNQAGVESGLFDGNPGYGISDDVGWDSLSDDRRAYMISLGFHPTRYQGSPDTSNAGPMGIGEPAGFGHNPGIDPDTGKTNAETAWNG